jgi:hypothetical protein
MGSIPVEETKNNPPARLPRGHLQAIGGGESGRWLTSQWRTPGSDFPVLIGATLRSTIARSLAIALHFGRRDQLTAERCPARLRQASAPMQKAYRS